MPPEEDCEVETKPIGGEPRCVTKRIVGIEVSRTPRLFLANRLIALGWGLKGFCKPCAQRLFTSARWLVPEAQRFLIQRTVSHNRNRRTLDFAVALRTLLSSIPSRVVAGLLIVLAFLGALDLATRTRAIDTQPIVENSSIPHEPQIQLERKIISVNKSLEPIKEFVSETASLPRAQIAPVPLPLRKPKVVYKVPNGKGAKGVRDTQKRMAYQKAARQKQMR
jgi:hypothetical protein